MILTVSIAKAIRLRAHFTLWEFVNWKAGGEIRKLDDKLLDALEYMRVKTKRSITITSGFRIGWFNTKVEGSPVSFHLEGKAADFKFDFTSYNKYSIMKLMIEAGFTNMKFYYRKNSRGYYYLHRVHGDVGKTWNGKAYCVLSNKYE